MEIRRFAESYRWGNELSTNDGNQAILVHHPAQTVPTPLDANCFVYASSIDFQHQQQTIHTVIVCVSAALPDEHRMPISTVRNREKVH